MYIWTNARRPVPRLWIRSAEVRGGVGGVVMRMGIQQQQQECTIRILTIDTIASATDEYKHMRIWLVVLGLTAL